MAAPFELYISFTAFYPIPAVRDSCSLLPTPTNLNWTNLNPSDILKNSLELSSGIDKEVSKIAIRTKVSGNFTIFGANYDLLINALDVLNLNELVIRIDRWNGATYDEYWRGTTEIRKSFDGNRKKATLSEFTTIDDYTDFLRYKKTNIVSSRSTGSGLDVKMEVQNVGTIQQAIFGQFELTTNFHNQALTQYSRTMEPAGASINYQSELFPSTYYFHGLSDDGVNGKRLLFGTVGMTADLLGNTDAEISLSHQKVFDIYEKLFGGSWYIGQDNSQQSCPSNSFIYLRRKRDTFNNNIVHSFINESADFKRGKYILPKLFTQQVHSFSKKNFAASHADADFTFRVNGDLEDKISESVVFTDAQRVYDANTAALKDDWLNDDDWFLGLGNKPVGGVPAWVYKEGATQLATTTNYELSLAWRMANDINDFQQLNSATYNNALRSLNPNFSQPAKEQVPFPINTTDIKSLDNYGITQTSLGNMRIIKATVGFNDIKANVICVQ